MNNNIETNKSKIIIDIGSNNLNNQINYKNINTNQTDKIVNHNNNKIIPYIKPLLLLLQKAEQIISIINLPRSSIEKYNQLKEISFKKCGLEYTPLEKNIEITKNFQKYNNNDNINNLEKDRIKYYKIIYELENIKNKLIDLILTFIEANSFINIINNKDNKSFLNNSNDFNNNCKSLKEDINRIINEKNNNRNINSDNNSINNNEESLIYNEKEKLLNYISRSQQNVISIMYENYKKFNELKEVFLIQNSKIEYLKKYIKDIDQLICPIWNKYYNNEIDWFDQNKKIDKYDLKTYTKSHFLLNFMNQLFTDNKNLMEALTDMEKKKNKAYNILKFPYIQKVIGKGEILKNIQKLLEKLKEEKIKNKDMDMKKLIGNGKELINSIKEIIMEEPKKDDNILKNSDNKNENYNNYNDDMNIFLGRLMNEIQNMLNKVDISLKKDELIENMIKINMPNKNLNIDNSNNTNMNVNISNSNMNINNITRKNFSNKDISFISANNNEISNSKIQNMSFQVYKKKTNHISGSNVIINNNKNEKENKDNYGIDDSTKVDLKKNILNNIINENISEDLKESYLNKIDDKKKLENKNNNFIDDNAIKKSINNIINDKNSYKFKNSKLIIKEKNNFENKGTINEEKIINLRDIGKNLLQTKNSKIIKNNRIEINSLNNIYNESKENINLKKENVKRKEEDITDENLEALKNMVLEDFKSRLSEEKENEE